MWIKSLKGDGNLCRIYLEFKSGISKDLPLKETTVVKFAILSAKAVRKSNSAPGSGRKSCRTVKLLTSLNQTRTIMNENFQVPPEIPVVSAYIKTISCNLSN